jgi:hypothetical protein
MHYRYIATVTLLANCLTVCTEIYALKSHLEIYPPYLSPFYMREHSTDYNNSSSPHFNMKTCSEMAR